MRQASPKNKKSIKKDNKYLKEKFLLKRGMLIFIREKIFIATMAVNQTPIWVCYSHTHQAPSQIL